jgi:protein MpaA
MQRLGKNIGGYFGDKINLVEVLRDVELAAKIHGWLIEDFLRVSTLRLFALHRPANSPAPRKIYVSTGIHGDEPAGPIAMLQLLQRNEWPADCEIWLCPCLNPAGFVLGTRENDKGVDLNRDYLQLQTDEIRAHAAWLTRQPQFDVCLMLHEDWESNGFYVYEQNPERLPSLAEAIIERVEKVCPIDRSEIIEGREAKNGIIRPIVDMKARQDWPESFYMINHKTRRSYTLEAPSDYSLQIRVDALVAGVNAAVSAMCSGKTTLLSH